MKLGATPILLICLTSALSSCFRSSPPLTNSSFGPGIGPFDAAGNYREDWADDPSKWRRPTANSPSRTPQESPMPMNLPVPAPAKQAASASKSQADPAPTKSTQRTAQRSSRSTPPPPKQTAAATRYTVKKGDTLGAIAKKFRTSTTAIINANRITGSTIFPGQRLVIPDR